MTPEQIAAREIEKLMAEQPAGYMATLQDMLAKYTTRAAEADRLLREARRWLDDDITGVEDLRDEITKHLEGRG
jgi:hypothetical protein